MDRLIKLILLVVSIYLIVVNIYFLQFLNEYPVFDGTEIVLYLGMFTVATIMLTFMYDNDLNKFIAFPLFGTVLLGVKTFYDVFIDISDLPMNVVKYDFNFFIYYTHFSEESFSFKIASANAFIFLVVGVCVVSFIGYITKKNNEDVKEA